MEGVFLQMDAEWIQEERERRKKQKERDCVKEKRGWGKGGHWTTLENALFRKRGE